jgi:hypothetical protein
LQAIVGHVDAKYCEGSTGTVHLSYSPWKCCPRKGVLIILTEKWDNFHEFIVCDELSRTGSGGFLWGLIGGLGIGLPPVIHFGSDYLKDKVIKDCIAGRKNICLAITEPSGGSDVANLVTEAKKSACGKFFILNGEKVRGTLLYIIEMDHKWNLCRLFYCCCKNWWSRNGWSLSSLGRKNYAWR